MGGVFFGSPWGFCERRVLTEAAQSVLLRAAQVPCRKCCGKSGRGRSPVTGSDQLSPFCFEDAFSLPCLEGCRGGQAEVRMGVKGGELLGNWGSGKTAPEALLLIPNPQHQALRKQSWELVRSAQNADSRKLLQVVLDTALLSRLLFPNRLWGVIKSFGRTS